MKDMISQRDAVGWGRQVRRAKKIEPCSSVEIERALNRVARRMKFDLYLTLARLNFLLFKIKLSRARVGARRFLLRHLH